MKDILSEIYNYCDAVTKSKIRQTCLRLSKKVLNGDMHVIDDIIYYAVGRYLHREDGPAKISKNAEYWHYKGKLHRTEDKPAVRVKDGYILEWWVDGMRHREGGPAYICRDIKKYYIRDKKHRVDGPADICVDGEKWYLNGLKHRADGPFLVSKLATYYDGDKWYLHGIRYTTNFAKLIHGEYMGGKYINGVPHGVIKNKYCTTIYKHGKLHNERGPAKYGEDYRTAYYIDGIRHRGNGLPAVYCSSEQYYYVRGILHRDDGPAIIHPTDNHYYIHGRAVLPFEEI